MVRQEGFGVVLAAGGAGRRFGAKKQFLRLAGRPLFLHGVGVFASCPEVAEIVVVVPAEDVGDVESLLPRVDANLKLRTVAGGARRQDSVRLGLECFWDDLEWALVHDAARPLVRGDEVRRVMAAVKAHGAAVLGHPASDSIKEGEDGHVVRSLDRRRIWQVQTPQGAACELFQRAYAALEGDEERTDEVGLLEGVAPAIRLIEGSRENIKVTAPGDLELAEFLFRRRQAE